ncbi:MAG: hypothetical protein SGPRY_012436, partial [Prymnesium sp.]
AEATVTRLHATSLGSSPAPATPQPSMSVGLEPPHLSSHSRDLPLLGIPRWKPIPGVEEWLVDLLHAPANSWLAQLSTLLRRLDDLSHVLAWSSGEEAQLSTVELPRLRLSFEVRTVGGKKRLYSHEHSGFYISMDASAAAPLLRGLPHAVVLQGDYGELALLVSSAAKPHLTASGRVLLHRGDSSWLSALSQARHYLYPVHPSTTHLCSPTLASSLYLLLLYFLHAMHAEVFRLVDACTSDLELSPEERQIWEAFRQAEQHTAADACSARLKLHLIAHDTAAMGSPWPTPMGLTLIQYVKQRHLVSTNCRLSVEEEVSLLDECLEDASHPLSLDEELTMLREYRQTLEACLKAAASPIRIQAAPRRRLLSGGRWSKLCLWFDMSVQPHQMRQAGGETELRLPSYMRQLSNSKEEALGFLLKAMEEKSLRSNFLLLYDMLTGERYFRIVADDKSEVLADLMLRLLPPAEWESHTPLLAMLSLMVSIHQARLDGQAGGKEAMEDMLNRMPSYDQVKQELDLENGNAQAVQAVKDLIRGDEVGNRLMQLAFTPARQVELSRQALRKCRLVCG